MAKNVTEEMITKGRRYYVEAAFSGPYEMKELPLYLSENTFTGKERYLLHFFLLLG